ncbi:MULTISPECIES: efflux RND transporter periplasmic adaptor subunit [Maribacter]|uniref:Efflux RND transporter periplasmic adaptor subunit n=1 Tax=Maribacter flavus TaxID=1658664 RepID=A0ABU7IEQ5_9FLAO|nr:MULTISPECIES: efflux RND transporter periplasmic adaptor subunit [Maribacter]MDC6404283.1 efflux RND transporter periplasmic adaptor subunit [Maribacter sp. PR66]MEE1971425.1 efflux RND transporter periplasmic adaptor subunit [Maribacter flavus]
MKNNLYISVMALAALTIFASCGNDQKTAVATKGAAISVTTSTVTQNSNDPFLTVSGKVEAARSANISTRMMGYVDKIYVQVGEKVTNGQLLLSVNNADVSAKLAQVNAGIAEATAAYTNAEKDYNRFTALFKENSASQKELDDVTAHYTMAKARLESAKQMKNEVNAQMGYANIRAPFSGVVTNKFINTGDMANPGMPLLEVEAPGTYQVLAMVPESEISEVKNDTHVTVLIKSLEKIVKGTVTEVSTSSKNTGGQYMVKVVLEKTDIPMLSGMYATVQFPVSKKASKAAVMVPIDVLVKNGSLTGIYTVSESNTALLRWLRLGRTLGDKVEVLSGLAHDEEYIVSSEGKLYNGAKLAIQ